MFRRGVLIAVFVSVLLVLSPLTFAQQIPSLSPFTNAVTSLGVGNCVDGLDNDGDGFVDYLSPDQITNLTTSRSVVEAGRHALISQFVSTQQQFYPFIGQLQNSISPYNQAQIDTALVGITATQQVYTDIYNQVLAKSALLDAINTKLLTDPECTTPFSTESVLNPPEACYNTVDDDNDNLIDYVPQDRREHAAAEQQLLMLSSDELTTHANQVAQIQNLLAANYNTIVTQGLATPQYLGDFYVNLGGWVNWANDFVQIEQYAINVALPKAINSDPDCSSPFDTTESPFAECNDGADNDGDLFIDYPQDPGCSSAYDNTEAPFDPGLTQCSDSADNDADLFIDFPQDPGCSSPADNDESPFNSGLTLCSDGVDNDGDLFIDFPNDPGCSDLQDNDESPFNPGMTQCSNTLDDDFDGLIDLLDPGCTDPMDNDESDATSQCQDGADNDQDAATDYPADFSCSSPTDNDEFNPLAQCQDNLDNDGDNLIDIFDPGCASSQDNDESDGTSQCQDGVDNDGDFFVDFPNDPGCLSFTDNDESPFNSGLTQCSDGADNDGDLFVDLLDPNCANAQDNDESPFDPGLTQCSDGTDNDGDTLIDLADPGCANQFDNDESPFNVGFTKCSNGIDDDHDGFIDYPADQGCSSIFENDELPFDFAPPSQTEYAPQDYRLFLSRIRFQGGDIVRAGDTLGLSVNLKNEGQKNFDALSFSVSVPELGLYSGKTRGDLNRGDSGSFTRVLTIPSDTPPGEHYARVTFYVDGNSGRRTVYMPFTVV